MKETSAQLIIHNSKERMKVVEPRDWKQVMDLFVEGAFGFGGTLA
jgi:hypothetical protein